MLNSSVFWFILYGFCKLRKAFPILRISIKLFPYVLPSILMLSLFIFKDLIQLECIWCEVWRRALPQTSKPKHLCRYSNATKLKRHLFHCFEILNIILYGRFCFWISYSAPLIFLFMRTQKTPTLRWKLQLQSIYLHKIERHCRQC